MWAASELNEYVSVPVCSHFGLEHNISVNNFVGIDAPMMITMNYHSPSTAIRPKLDLIEAVRKQGDRDEE